MSFTTSVVLITVLDALIVAALAGVCLIPFRLDRSPAAGEVRRIGSVDLLEVEDAAA